MRSMVRSGVAFVVSFLACVPFESWGQKIVVACLAGAVVGLVSIALLYRTALLRMLALDDRR